MSAAAPGPWMYSWEEMAVDAPGNPLDSHNVRVAQARAAIAKANGSAP